MRRPAFAGAVALSLVAFQASLIALPVAAAPATPLAQEVRRGLAAVGDGTSEAPALRREGAAHEVPPGFALGAALGAWRNARARIDFDRAHPAGDGGDGETLRTDCSDEEIAFGQLRAQAATQGLDAQAVTRAAGLDAEAAAWMARTRARPDAC